MRWNVAAFAVALSAALLPAPSMGAEDDLGKLLDDIPDVPNAEQPKAEEEAAPVEAEVATLPAYVKAVKMAVLENWEPKPKLVKKNPKAKSQFLVKLDINGERMGVSAVELSGIKSFDQSVLDAIAATTFPAPPPTILSDVERGVVVTIAARNYGK